MKKRSRWKYKHTTLFISSLLAIVLLADTQVANEFMVWVGGYGYLGAMAIGVFLVSTFTVVPASFVLLDLATDFNPMLIAIYGGAGSALGDLLVFRFFKDMVFEELAPIFRKFRNSYLARIFKARSLKWLLPVFGALVIASPLPDEVGIGLMGLSKIRLWQFTLLAFILNAIGIFVLINIVSLV